MEIDDEVIPNQDVKDGEEKGKPILVILMGAPGSGKSTFCDHVMRVSTRPWVRVCQDTIGNGKAGTKTQCVMSAATALSDGKSVFIDRCNLDKEQRADFVKLGDSHQVDVHAVVLDLPAKLCISRSVKRTGHEGNLQGGKAAAVVNRMLQKKELPKLNEGFSRITVCQNETDVQAATNTYGALSLSDVLPSGFFGPKNPDTKVQLGIMKFLKKVDAPDSAVPDSNRSQRQVPDKKNKESHALDCGPEDHAIKVMKDRQEQKSSFSSRTVPPATVLTLAFPSISTADFQFDIEKASEIIVEKVDEFIRNFGNARLFLVDLSHGSKILSLVKTKAMEKNIDPGKFLTFVGDITRLYSGGGLRCNVIANAANWRLKPGGGGVNAAIFSAAGQELESATKARASSLSPGKAVVVPLPSTSPLCSREGVTHVIHVLGPNMNPQRPNCLSNDYVKGCKVLREAYSSLFESFASIVMHQDEVSNPRIEKLESGVLGSYDQHELRHIDQFAFTDQKVKREGTFVPERNKKSKGCIDDDRETSVQEKGFPSSTSGRMNEDWGFWAQTLYRIAMHPEKHQGDVIEISDDVVVLNDVYPKAQKHILVLARTPGVDSLADVRKEHLELFRKMHIVGLKWAEKFQKENDSLIFRLGYHSVPSMRQLHLHVISQDFDSKCLRNKKHWNSFNTPFFRDSVDVIKEVEEHGEVRLNNDESFLSKELRCHKCRSAHPNIPRLKSHLQICRATFPDSLLQNNRLVFVTKNDDV